MPTGNPMASRETLKILIQTLRTQSREPRILATQTHSANPSVATTCALQRSAATYEEHRLRERTWQEAYQHINTFESSVAISYFSHTQPTWDRTGDCLRTADLCLRVAPGFRLPWAGVNAAPNCDRAWSDHGFSIGWSLPSRCSTYKSQKRS